MQSIAVFCGSKFGKKPAYEEIARTVGELLAERNLRLVYGGGDIGLMGVLANTVVQQGGEVLGVIPDFLMQVEGRNAVAEQIEVKTMHERKSIMAEESDGFLILPGGFGTMDEFFEILTWRQLQLHHKPIGILNMDGYYDHLIALFDHMMAEGFVRPVNRALVIVESSPEALLDAMQAAYTTGADELEKS